MSENLTQIANQGGYPIEQKLTHLDRFFIWHLKLVDSLTGIVDEGIEGERPLYSCKIHLGETLELFRLRTDADTWYLYGRCREDPNLVIQVSKYPKSLEPMYY